MKRVTFIVGVFPVASETYIISQVAGLLKRGIEVEIFSFGIGNPTYVAKDYESNSMLSRTVYLDFPLHWPKRALKALRSAIQLLRYRPMALLRALNIFKYGANAYSLKLLCWAGPLVNMSTDVVHCHFGTTADWFRILRDILGFDQPWVTSFYGADVSRIPQQKGKDAYYKLIRTCPKFLVMSEDMKKRVMDLGFPADKILVHPVGINTENYLFRERTNHSGPIQLVSVARLVEKKGIDDLIRAIAVVRQKISREFKCTIIGDGPLREQLQNLANENGVNALLEWTGFLKQEKMLGRLNRADLYIQPSKTAANGDME